MAHELAHVLQAHPGHSEEGLMKARWSEQDLDRMIQSHLAFTADDAAAIRLSVERRIAASTASGLACQPTRPVHIVY